MSSIVHFEISVDDAERAAEFYRQVFGWRIEKWAGPIDYWMVATGTPESPGIGGALRQRDEIAGGTINSIGVQSVDAALDRVAASGGKIVMPKMPIPGTGYMAYCRDPEGNVFGVFQEDPAAH